MNSFFVHGRAAPKGSAKAFQGIPFGTPCPACKNRRRGHPRVVQDSPFLEEWTVAIRGTARAARMPKIEAAVEVHLDFHMKRPGNHFRTGKFAHLLKDDAPIWHTITPDVDKLERGVLDGMTDICFGDDCTVVMVTNRKFYSSTPGVRIRYRAAEIPCDLKTRPEEPSQDELPGLAGTKASEGST